MLNWIVWNITDNLYEMDLATYYHRKISKLDEPDMRDTAGDL